MSINLDELKTFAETEEGKKALLSLPQVKSYGDARANGAIKTHVEKWGSSPDILQRVEKIELNTKQKIEQLKLENYTAKKSLSVGIDPSLLEGFALKDREQIDRKIEQLLGNKKALQTKEVNQLMAESSRKPGSGNGPSPSVRIENMSEDEIINRIETDPKGFAQLIASGGVHSGTAFGTQWGKAFTEK